MKWFKRMTKGEAVFLLIAGLILGTVFTFGMKYWNAPVAQDEAQHISAVFSSAKVHLRRLNRVQEIIVCFEDHEQLYIDGACVDSELTDAVFGIDPGTAVEMVVSPNSDTILEMKAGTTKLLEYHDSVQKLSAEASEFMWLGVFCYMMALIGAGYLVLSKQKGYA